MSVMERRPWTKRQNRHLPKRFRDPLPEGPPCILPSLITHPHQSPADEGTTPSPSLYHRIRHIFTTERNIFGLSRRYEASDPPSHDPEENVVLNELSDIPSNPPASDSPSPSFYPYPNHNSFLLGDWYWNGGVQKTQSSFRELVAIVGNPEFNPTDVKYTQWDKINHVLGSEDDQGEWLDEDAGWDSTPITISVPYQSSRGVASNPSAGPRNFTVPQFYHRNLISVIREKITNPTDAPHFHYEPYELHWQPQGSPHSSRVYGELYTSPAFIDAHRNLQESPTEPGCNLPRVVAGLMFWSDATHLTSFGEAKLWPLYLFFGNESKNRRCKPSFNACHHIAYFQQVGSSSFPDLFI